MTEDFTRREQNISADEHREQAERLDKELWHEDRDTKPPQRAQEPNLGRYDVGEEYHYSAQFRAGLEQESQTRREEGE